MRVVEHPSAAAFVARAGGWLAEREAEHGLFFTITARIRDGAARLLTVEGGRAVVAAALQTPPRKWVVSRASDEAVGALAAHLVATGRPVPGVLGPALVAQALADCWQEHSGRPYRIGKAQRIWEVRAVVPPRRVPGARRVAGTGDLDTVTAWARAFAVDVATDETPDDVAALTTPRLAAGRVHLWEDGRPVAMTVVGDSTPTGLGVHLVYTPPAERGKGFASALVAAVSADALAAGRRFCFLFTDLAAPVPNHVYEKIGYRPVADWADYFFG